MQQKRPTIRDVAEQAGVSKSTVGYVLSGNMDVAIPDSTRARVLDAARKIGYRRNVIAESFATGKGRNVGVLVSFQGYVNGYQDAFVSRILYGLQEACVRKRHAVLLAAATNERGSVMAQASSMLEQQIAGLVVVGRLAEADMNALLVETDAEGVSCVVVDDRSFSEAAHCVVTDDVLGANLATRRLIETGRTRIAHLSAGTAASTARDREAGYRAALIEAGLLVDENLTRRSSFLPKDALGAAEMLLSETPRPDAIFADSDYLAAAVLQAVSRRGLRVPDDIALVGYGDLQVAEWLDLTTVRQNPEEMGRRVADVLFGERGVGSGTQEIMMPVELIERGSCGGLSKT